MQTNFRNSTGTRSRGKQWTYRALHIFELCVCEYDHLNSTRCADLRVSLNFINVRHLIYLYNIKFYNYIHGKYIWNRSVMLTNNACFVKRNIKVKNITRKVYAITKNIVASTHCAFEGWSMFKLMKPSMWYVDDKRWEAGSTTTNCKLNARFLSSQLIQYSKAYFACLGAPM